VISRTRRVALAAVVAVCGSLGDLTADWFIGAPGRGRLGFHALVSRHGGEVPVVAATAFILTWAFLGRKRR